MEEILIIALILGAGYYLITHQPEPKVNQSPIIQTSSQSTQTDPVINPDDKDLEKTLDTLIRNIKQLNHQIK